MTTMRHLVQSALRFLLAPLYWYGARFLCLYANPMMSTDFRSIVAPILNDSFDGRYDKRKDEWKMSHEERTGIPRSYHEEPVLFGLGAAPEIPDGEPVPYDAGGELYQARYVYKVVGTAYAMTRILVEDGDHIRIGTMFASEAADAMAETKETKCANNLNRAFNAAFPGGDGVPLVSAAHPLGPSAGLGSNLLAAPAALSQTSAEQMLIQIRRAFDDRQKRIRLTPLKFIVEPANMFQAEQIVKSVLRPDTANNAINAIKSMGLLQEETAVMSRLTSPTAWWIKTDAPRGLTVMMRRRLSKEMQGDFETDSTRWRVSERYEPFWTVWRTAFGTPGL